MKANKRQLAEIFAISEETITQWSKACCPVELKRRGTAGNVYDTGQVFAWRVGRSDAISGTLDPAQERARLHEAQRLRLEREAAVARGELDYVRLMEKDFDCGIRAIRDAMIAWPAKIAAMGANMDDRELCLLLDREMRAELTRIADINPEGDPVSNPFRNRKPRRKR